MTTIKFMYKNLWREGEILTKSTQHAQFPVVNTQDDIKTLAWRARYGTGSGNGQFVVGNTNKYIDFDEGGAELTATLTAGTYNGQTLTAEIKTQMDTAGGTYTVTYSETTGKFTISRAAGNFTIRWQNGTNTANNAAGLLGFNKAADDTGAATFTSDYIAIHTSEYADCDLGAALEYDFIALLNHNLTSAAVITAIGADDSAFTTNVVSDTVPWNAVNIFNFLAAARTKRYLRLQLVDPKNPACFLQIGTIVVAKSMTPNRNMNAYTEGEIDESETDLPPSGNLFVVQERAQKINWDFPFVGLDPTSVAQVRAMNRHCGVTKAIVFCTNTAAPNTNSYWARFKESSRPELGGERDDYWNWTAILEEVL